MFPKAPRFRTTSIQSRSNRSAGFTLIELMVVVFLVGIITTFAMLSIRSDPWDGELARQLQQMNALVAAGKDQAVLRSEEYSILFSDDGYAFQRQGDKGWEPVVGDPLFRERKLPEGVVLRLEIEDRELKLDADNDKEKPLVLLMSSGEVTPFAVTLVVFEAGLRVRQRWNTFGELESDSDSDSDSDE